MVSHIHTTLALAAWVIAVQAADIELDITPEPLVMDESLQLVFRVTGEVERDPDFAPLEVLFTLIGRNRQTSIKWVNGRREQTTSWVINAMPRHTGEIEIPAITFGSARSPTRKITVIASSGAPVDSDAKIIVQVEATPRNPYVQQQVIYTFRLLHRVDLANPRFSSITTSADAIIKPLGKGRQFIHKVKGRSYEAFEQRYAIFPQKSGPLTIHPLVLTTQIRTGKRNFSDLFARALTTKRVKSDPVELEVRPVPAVFPDHATWLPARRLRLYEEWEPDVEEAEIGAPLSRTIFLWAEGLVSGQVPLVEFDAPPGIKIYPDKPQSNDQDTASGFTMVLQEKFAFIPGRSGTARFGPLRVPWWNIETDQMETAELPERTLRVAETALAADRVQSAPVAEPAVEQSVPAAPRLPAVGARDWFWIACVLGAGWLATLGLWFLKSLRVTQVRALDRSAAPPRPAAAVADLKTACGADDPGAARAALMNWSTTIFGATLDSSDAIKAPGPAPLNLRSLALRLEGELGREINRLEQRLYGQVGTDWRGSALWDAFLRYRPSTAPDTIRSNDPLPPIFKLAEQ